MESKLLLFSVLSIFLITSCNDTKNDPIVTPPPVEKEVTLKSLITDLSEASNVKTSLKGVANTYLNPNSYFDKEIVFSPNSYLIKEMVGETYLTGGYVNKGDYVGAFRLNEDETVSSSFIRSKDYNDYHSIKFNFNDLDLTNFNKLDDSATSYTLDLTMIGESYLDQVDYYNYVVLLNLFNFGTFNYLIDEVTFIKTNTDKLEISFKGELNVVSSENDPNPYLSTLEGVADVEINDTNYNNELESKLSNVTFSEQELKDEKSLEMINKINSGYMIKDYPLYSTDGEPLGGDIYSTEDYIVYDYSNHTAELLTGYCTKNGYLYQVNPTSTGIYPQLLFDTKGIQEINDELGTNYSAIEIGKILFQASYGCYLPDATLINQNKFLLKYDDKLDYFTCDDPLNLFGIGASVDSDFQITVFSGKIAGGYSLDYTDETKEKIEFGYYYYSSNLGNIEIVDNPLSTISDFGSVNEIMEILVSRL